MPCAGPAAAVQAVLDSLPPGRGTCTAPQPMGSDNRGKKSLNWKAAKCALHCNNCVTLLLGILLLVFGLVNYHHAQRTAIKYRLCNDVMFQNMMQTNIIVKQMPGLLSNETIKKLCHPDSQDHCTRHSDCRPGYYCDEDYNCWDCDFVLKKEEDCDGFDGHCDKCLRAPASTISKDTTVVRAPPLACVFHCRRG